MICPHPVAHRGDRFGPLVRTPAGQGGVGNIGSAARPTHEGHSKRLIDLHLGAFLGWQRHDMALDRL